MFYANIAFNCMLLLLLFYIVVVYGVKNQDYPNEKQERSMEK